MIENYLLILLFFFIGAFVFSVIINRLLLKFVKTLGIRNQNEAIIRWSSGAKPALGGISFYIVFLLAIIMYPFEKNVSGCFINPSLLGVFVVCTLGFLLGLYDDAYNTKPWLKFFTQIACGVILIATGTYIQIFDNEIVNYFITVFWVVGIMNAMNLLDNMDGITSIVSISILLSVLAILFYTGDISNNFMFLIVGVIAALAGFLIFNWHPSKMYMGDTGSMFIGVFLAAIGIVFFWNGSNFEDYSNPYIQITGVVMAFALPIIDTTTVFVKRILKGGSPFVGGKDHTTHHIGYLGLKDNMVAWVFIILSITFAFITVAVFGLVSIHNLHYLLYFWILFILAFIIIFIIANMNKDKN